MNGMKLYLDTHVVVWLYAGDAARFPDTAKKLLESCELYVSPIVLLELTYLYEIDRISVDSEHIILTLTNQLNLKVCDRLFSEVVMEAMKLNWTRDPFDRIIVATATLSNCSLLSKDKLISKNCSNAIWE